MAETSIDILKSYFKAGERPTEAQFADLMDSFVHLSDPRLKKLIGNMDIEGEYLRLKSDDGQVITQLSMDHFENKLIESNAFLNALIEKLPSTKGELDFTGRFYFYSDKRWVGAHPYYGQAYYNYNYSHGSSVNPNVLWNSLGIGFLPKGTILHHIEFVGMVNSTQVQDIQVHLSSQGSKFDNGGYDSTTEADNNVILSQLIGSNAPNLGDMQRHIIELNDFVLENDGIIEFCCKPVGDLTTTMYWYAQRKLYFTKP